MCKAFFPVPWPRRRFQQMEAPRERKLTQRRQFQKPKPNPHCRLALVLKLTEKNHLEEKTDLARSKVTAQVDLLR